VRKHQIQTTATKELYESVIKANVALIAVDPLSLSKIVLINQWA
jgi:hypothetical protein